MSIHGTHGSRRSGRLRVLLGLACAAGLVTSGCTADGRRDAPEAVPRVTGPLELVAYGSCDALARDFREAYERSAAALHGSGEDAMRDAEAAAPRAVAAPQAPGSGDTAAPAPMTGTNIQEAGVDEPDLVKTDGRRVFTLDDGTLRVVDVTSRQLTGTLVLPRGSAGTSPYAPGAAPDAEMFVAGDRVLVILPGSGLPMPPSAAGAREPGVPEIMAPGGSRLVLVDVAGTPRVVGELTLDGAYADARLTGSTARVVVRSIPRALAGGSMPGLDARGANVRAALARTTADDWLPHFRLTSDGHTSEGVLTPCDRVSRTVSAGGPGLHDADATVSVLTVDLAGPLGTGDAVTIAGDAGTVYGNGSSLYVASATPSWAGRDAAGPATVINRFDVSGTGRPRHVAAGLVEGVLLDQYAMSEHDGRLRVATTFSRRPSVAPESARGGADAPAIAPARPDTESAVIVLETRDGRLEEIGRAGGLGRGERIHSVRFLGTTGYVVTFRQTDPLYTVDLRDPRSPRVTGELKINGYSAYLHPAGDGRLIGVGQDATATGARLGTQISLFDTSDPADPRRIAQYTVPGTASEVENNPRAFVFRPQDGTLVVPLSGGPGWISPAMPPPGASSGATAPMPPRITPVPAAEQPGALVLRVHDGSFTQVGTVRHQGGATVRRALLLGDGLWTVSTAGVRVDAAGDLAPVAWIPFGA